MALGFGFHCTGSLAVVSIPRCSSIQNINPHALTSLLSHPRAQVLYSPARLCTRRFLHSLTPLSSSSSLSLSRAFRPICFSFNFNFNFTFVLILILVLTRNSSPIWSVIHPRDPLENFPDMN